MNKKIVCALVALTAILGAWAANEMISLNFYSEQGTVSSANGSVGLAPVPGGNWMNLTGANGTISSVKISNADGSYLVDYAGTTGTYSSNNGYQWTSATSPILKGYLDDGGNHAVVSLSNIPFSSYDIIVYCATDNSGKYFAPVSLTVGGVTTLYTADSENAEVARTADDETDGFGLSQGKEPAYATGSKADTEAGTEETRAGNAIRITGIGSNSFTLTGGANNNKDQRGGIAAIQIVNTGTLTLNPEAQTERYVLSEEGGYYELNVAKTFKNVDLDYVKGVFVTFMYSMGGYNTSTKVLTEVKKSADGSGIYFYENDGTTLTFQPQQDSGYAGYMFGFLINAVQDGADVKVTLAGHYSPGASTFGTDFRKLTGNSGDFNTAAIPDSDTSGHDMALPDLQLIVSSELQVIPDTTQVLTYNGIENGVGVWSVDAVNWLKENGEATAWIEGSDVRFVTDGTITIQGAKNVRHINMNCESLVLTGDALTFAEETVLTYETAGNLRFENTVNAEILTQTTTLDSVVEKVYLKAGEEQKILPAGSSLENLGVFSFTVESNWWGLKKRQFSNACVVLPEEGIYDWQYDAANKTATFKIVVLLDGYYNQGAATVLKVRLTEQDDGIYSEVLYVKSKTGWTTDGVIYHAMDIDYDALEADDSANLIGPADELNNSKVRVYDFASSVSGSSRKYVASTEIAGDLVINEKGSLTISGYFALVDDGTLNGGEIYGRPLALATDSLFRFASTTPQKFNPNTTKYENATGAYFEIAAGSDVTIPSVGESCTIKQPLRLYGTLTLGKDLYHYFLSQESDYLTIYDGGILNANYGYAQYGHRDFKVTCHAGGRINYLTVRASGASDQYLTLKGGELYLAADYAEKLNEDTTNRKITLSDGAKIFGEMMTWAWQNTANEIFVQGTSPSFVTAEKLRFGQKGQTASESTKNMVEKISVTDVTGDEEADFIVSSTFYLNPETNWDADEYCGIEKTGAGTMLLTGTNSVLAGSLKVKEGTVAFGTHASGEPATLDGMALWMQGGTVDFGASKGSDFTELKLDADSAFVAQKGARVTFADSSAVAWTEGAQLLISGDWTRRTFRVGTSDQSLTPEQLAQIRCVQPNGKTSAVRLSGDGYLLPPWEGFSIILR